MKPTAADRHALTGSPLFAGVAPDALQALLDGLRMREASAGERLLEPGRENDSVYVVVSGALGVFADETARLPLATIGPGGCTGEQSVVDRRDACALVVATAPARIAVIGAGLLWEAMQDVPRVAFNLLQLLSRRIRIDNERTLAFEATASTDVLTGLHNRRWMEEMFERELLRCERTGEFATLLMIDIDRFKQVNDSLGHPAGDRLLARLGELMQRALRPHDLCARYGGEEFCVLLPGMGARKARQAAERLRECVARKPAAISRDVAVSYTVSIGVAERQAGQALAELVRAADEALYAAKRAGRNRVEIAGVRLAAARASAHPSRAWATGPRSARPEIEALQEDLP